MNCTKLLESWRREEQQPFVGWNFSYLDGRTWADEGQSWSYMDRAAVLLQHASSAIDLDTGGGERLLELQPHWSAKMAATESYPPNFKLATQRLVPLGVQVVDVEMSDDGLMPFADGEYDLVLNRNGAFNPSEIARILAAGGRFLTQQVHGLTNWDLSAAFGAAPSFPDATPEKYVPRLQAAGLVIEELKEAAGRHGFTDVGALVYYLKAIPWTVPGFSVETHSDNLFALQDRLEKGEALAFEWRSYLIEARKP